MWSAAINRALEKRAGGDKIKALDDLAEKLLAACESGDLPALKELGDRLEGKPGQSIDLGSDPDRPVLQKIVREIVRTQNKDG